MPVRKTLPAAIIDGAEINRIVSNEELFSHGNLFAFVRLQKGAVVPWHEHFGEAEYYYILSGNGIFTDHDRTEQAVGKNDVCTIKPGQGHAIRNECEKDLEFIALIIKE